MAAKLTDHKDLSRKATEIRISVIEMLEKAGSGHVGGPLSIADVLTYLYYNLLNHDPQKPQWDSRDYFLMSNGHVCPVWYAILADWGYFPTEELDRLRKLDGKLQGHPLNTSVPGIINSSGPLGHGVPQAVGVAIGLKLDKKENQVYCLMSDGEQQEGAIWESALNAAKNNLDNLTLILDLNNIQIDGMVPEIMPLPDLESVYSEFGFAVSTCDGHDFESIAATFAELKEIKGQPKLLIAHTVAGKGVSSLEGKFQSHDWKGEPGQAEQALNELNDLLTTLV